MVSVRPLQDQFHQLVRLMIQIILWPMNDQGRSAHSYEKLKREIPSTFSYLLLKSLFLRQIHSPKHKGVLR
jgi:hypothetical protein